MNMLRLLVAFIFLANGIYADAEGNTTLTDGNQSAFDRPCVMESTESRHGCPVYEECIATHLKCQCIHEYFRDVFNGGSCTSNKLNNSPKHDESTVDYTLSETYDRQCIYSVDHGDGGAADTTCPLGENCVSVASIKRRVRNTVKKNGDAPNTVMTSNGVCKCTFDNTTRDVTRGGECVTKSVGTVETNESTMSVNSTEEHVVEENVKKAKSTTISIKPVYKNSVETQSHHHHHVEEQPVHHMKKSPMNMSHEEHPKHSESHEHETQDDQVRSLNIKLLHPPSIVILPLKKPIVLRSMTWVESSSHPDHQHITASQASFTWSQVKGPKLDGFSVGYKTPILTINKIPSIGIYKFIVKVSSKIHGEASAEVAFLVKRSKNKPPVARAGLSRMTVSLNNDDVLQLDGSRSYDDSGHIASFRWTRLSDSLSAGDVLDDSEHKSVLRLTNLIPGKYWFQLEVRDEDGLAATDTVKVTVLSNGLDVNLFDLFIQTNYSSFTEGLKEKIVKKLQGIANNLLNETGLTNETVSLKAERVLEEFVTHSVILVIRVTSISLKANVVVRGIKQFLKSHKNQIGDLIVSHVDTRVCMNTCSGRGTCDIKSRKCICHDAWVSNWFEEESNCDWHLAVVVLIIIIALVIAMSFLVCCYQHCNGKLQWCRRRCRSSKTHPIKYGLLNDLDFSIKRDFKISKSAELSDDDNTSSEDDNVLFSRSRNI